MCMFVHDSPASPPALSSSLLEEVKVHVSGHLLSHA